MANQKNVAVQNDKLKSLDRRLRQQVGAELGYYVYLLIDPRNGKPFYVGKGRGTRFSSHGIEADLSDPEHDDLSPKTRLFNEIRAAGKEPEIWILRYGMTSSEEYTAVEAAAIDLLHSFPVSSQRLKSRAPEQFKDQLTNKRREKYRGHGIRMLDDLIAEKAAPALTIEYPLLIVSLGSWTDHDDEEEIAGGRTRTGFGYKEEWENTSVRVQNFDDIGKSTCAWWKISPDRVEREGIEFVVASYRGITRAVFEIIPDTWEELGDRRGFQYNIVRAGDIEIEGIGDLYNEVVGKYGKRLPEKKNGDQSQFRYWNENMWSQL